jgi:biotin carboxyl carrier protein
MKHEQIAHWVQRLEASGLRAFEFEEDGTVLRLQFGRLAAAPATPGEPAPETASTSAAKNTVVRAPTAGLFHAGHPLSDHVSADMRVRKGDIVGFLRVEEEMMAVVAPCDGRLCPSEIADGTLVGYGRALFDIS